MITLEKVCFYMKKIFFIGLCLLGTLGFAQQGLKLCDFDNEQKQFSESNKAIMEIMKPIRNRINQAKANGNSDLAKTVVNGVYEIPVVVHVIVPTGAALGSAFNKTDAQIQTWIDNMNKMYAGTYTWSQGVPVDFGIPAVMPIKLVLAKRDPNCASTTGIIRYDGSQLSGYDTYGVKRNNTTGVTTTQVKSIAPHWPEKNYFNIYVINKIDSGSTYGIMGWCGLATNPNSSYESFMKSFVVTLQDDVTLAHEFGHAMGLFHTFDGADPDAPAGTIDPYYCTTNTGNCEDDDDYICDTEYSRSLLNDFPAPTNSDINPCTGVNYQGVQYNMMNYTNPIAFKFTPGQHDFSQLYFFAFKAPLASSLGATPISSSPPSIGTPIAASCVPSGIAHPVNSTNNYAPLVGPTSVKLGTIDNITTGIWLYDTSYYEDYTAATCLRNTSTELLVSQQQTIQVGFFDQAQSIKVWIDYNNNGTFDTNELVASGNNVAVDPTTDFGTFSGSFTAPSNVVLNTPLRMRVISDYSNSNITPCGQLNYGQAEDYTVKFVNTLGTSEVNANSNNFAVYPNPVKEGEGFFIKMKDAKNLDVTVSDMSGKLIGKPSVEKQNNDTYKVNQNLSKGVYMIQVSNGKDKESTKLIVN